MNEVSIIVICTIQNSYQRAFGLGIPLLVNQRWYYLWSRLNGNCSGIDTSYVLCCGIHAKISNETKCYDLGCK